MKSGGWTQLVDHDVKYQGEIQDEQKEERYAWTPKPGLLRRQLGHPILSG